MYDCSVGAEDLADAEASIAVLVEVAKVLHDGILDLLVESLVEAEVVSDGLGALSEAELIVIVGVHVLEGLKNVLSVDVHHYHGSLLASHEASSNEPVRELPHKRVALELWEHLIELELI